MFTHFFFLQKCLIFQNVCVFRVIFVTRKKKLKSPDLPTLLGRSIRPWNRLFFLHFFVFLWPNHEYSHKCILPNPIALWDLEEMERETEWQCIESAFSAKETILKKVYLKMGLTQNELDAKKQKVPYTPCYKLLVWYKLYYSVISVQ